ncbi:Ig-like domain-containing protein, partial [Pelodictyon luteolum]|uniref:DUF4347 domain-containing protein n=1 Tax=Pelodictyon luteolum TaxID=1100 RepID=UPI000AFC430A
MSVAEPHAVCLEQACERAYSDVNKRLTLKSPEVLLYDPGVAEVEVLLAGLDPAVQPLAVQPSDSPQEILAFLISHPQLTALHILGHGGPGAVRFGGVQLNAEDFHVPVDALIQRARLIDIYFWSCRTAQGAEGTTYLQAISENSMANVHASTGLIGETAKGGSWELDVTVSPTVRMPFSSAAREAFEGVLASASLLSTVLSTDKTRVILTYDELLTGTAQIGDFVFYDSGSKVTPSSVEIVGSSIVFTFSLALAGTSTTVAYAQETDLSNATTVAGTEADAAVIADFTAQSVTADSTAPTATLTYSTDSGTTRTSSVDVNEADTLLIKATFSEAIADGTGATIAIDNSVLSSTAMTKVSSTVYTYELNVPSGEISGAAITIGAATDLAGNTISATPTNATFDIDNTNPTTTPTVVALTTNDTTPTITGTATLATGESLSVTVNSKTYTVGDGNLTHDNGANTWSLTLPAADALSAGTYAVIATVTDAAGNTTADSTADEVVVDTTEPTLTLTSTLEGDNKVNAMEDGDVVVSGTSTGAVGQTVTVTLSDTATMPNTATQTATVAADGTWSLTGQQVADISSFTNGTITIKADVSDVAGNAATQASTTLTLDNVAPTISIATTLETDNKVNAAEDADVVISGATTGVEDGRIVSISLSDGTTTVNTTATVSSNAWIASAADISGLTNGTITVKADVSDLAGNPATQASKTLTLDNVVPTIAIATTLEGDNKVNASEDADVVVSGSTSGVEDGRTVNVTLSDGTNSVTTTATVSSNGWTAAAADISALTNGTITVTANVSDLAGNPAAEASKTLTLDNATPTISIATTLEGDNKVNASEDADVVVSGSTSGVEDGRTVNVTLSDGTNSVTTTATVSSNGWTAAAADISALTNGDITVTANVSDAAGNPAAQASKTVVLDNVAPTIFIATTLEGDNKVNAAEDGDVVVSGTTSGVEDGRTVNVTLSDGTNSVTTTATVSSNGWSATAADISTLTNGDITVTANVSDAAGNTAAEASKTLTLDNVAPTINSGTLYVWSAATSATLTLSATDGTWSSGTLTGATLASNGVLSVTTIPSASTTYSLTVTDTAGNAATKTITVEPTPYALFDANGDLIAAYASFDAAKAVATAGQTIKIADISDSSISTYTLTGSTDVSIDASLDSSDGVNLYGNDGNNTLIGGSKNDTLSGGIGNDTLQGGGGNDTLTGGTGNDSIDGGADNDTLTGGAGADAIVGDTGDDTIIYAAPSDLESDALSGGTGTDTVQINTSGTYDFSKLTSSTGIEKLYIAGDTAATSVTIGDKLADAGVPLSITGDSLEHNVTIDASALNSNQSISFVASGFGLDDTVTGGAGVDKVIYT